MKKILAILFVSVALMVSLFSSMSAAGLWVKYTANDGSFSFHYPRGWKVESNDSIVSVNNAATDEQLMMAAIPFERQKSPAELATGFIELLKKDNPNVRASNWKTETGTRDSQVVFDLNDKSNGVQYNGSGVVVKGKEQAMWFSYLAPAAGYSSGRGIALLQGFMGSMAMGSGSKVPDIDYTVDLTEKIDRNARAFMFVLEFSLGAPFTEAQEQVIMAELKSGWKSQTETELAKYDQYPALVQTILKMGQKDLEELRAELEKTIKAWIADSPPSDKAVQIIRNQLKSRGRVVISGSPPLTEMSLAAYSEIIAYSRLLQRAPQALPEQISQQTVNDIQKQVRSVWKSFSDADRKDIATTPGLWFCLRTLLRNGSKAEQSKVRSMLAKLSEETRNDVQNETQNQTGNGNPNTGNQKTVMNMAQHNSMMAIQQMTFNSYMWSQGFNYHPTIGKMW